MPKTKTKKASRTVNSRKETKPRRLQPTRYQSFRLSKRLKHPVPKELPGSFKLFRLSIKHVRKHWRLFGGVVAIYGLLYIILVQGLGSGLDISELKSSLQNIFGGRLNELGTGFVLFVVLLGSVSSTASEVAGIYQTILFVLGSLALIWCLRETWAAKRGLRIRDAFYHGMYPLVPFLSTKQF